MNIKQLTTKPNRIISEGAIEALSFGLEYNKFSIGNEGLYKWISYGAHGTPTDKGTYPEKIDE